jgi:glyoxylase-like metal-dependent hydrolase (beta-lactamase superfamily II)
VLPTNLALPGVGVLPVNAYVVLAEEPVLIDSGIGFNREEFIEALSSIVDPTARRWVWLTHDDADHTEASSG